MSDKPITLRIASNEESLTGALQAYLNEDEAKSRLRLPGPEAEEAIEVFKRGLLNLTQRCEDFILSADKQVSHLLLGKVQSGKTAHLLGALSWASDSSALASVVFTGVTGSLNDQTYSRLKSDLEALPGSPVVVLSVPTLSQSKLFDDFKSQLRSLSSARKDLGPSEPLPVLVTMKNAARVSAANAALKEVLGSLGNDSILFAIDDEADQASQNAKARQREVAATYESLSELRALPFRNIWLSYTATPQAVLLAEKGGKIRPDFVAIVPPRAGYFGLTDATSSSFAAQRIEVSDWRTQARSLTSAPQSLVDAVSRFLFVAWVRKTFPAHFYSKSPVKVDPANRMLSTQMLIHESSMTRDHSRMFRLVEDQCIDLKDMVENIVAGSASKENKSLLFSEFERVATALDNGGAQAKSLMPEFRSAEGQIQFLEILRDTKIMVINSDGSSPTVGEPRPISEHDYTRHDAWILIGGDILGRGITIPQLTVSYFMRSSKKPNFDTVLQQLRFCGYRRDYRDWLSIHAPKQSFDDLHYMNTVDTTVWNRAATWDKNKIKLTGSTMPRVFYAASKGARFDPTRIGVRDPDLSDKTIQKGTIASLREIFDPQDLRSNLRTLRTWHDECALKENSSDSHWARFDDIATVSIMRLLAGWTGLQEETARLEAVSELFDPALGNLGLSGTPTVTYISRLILDTWAIPESIVSRVDDIDVTRSVSFGAEESSWAEWLASFQSSTHLNKAKRAKLGVPHIGGGQRALRDRVDYDAVVFVIEPILGLSFSRNRSSAVALGIGLAVMSPETFEIRTIGHA